MVENPCKYAIRAGQSANLISQGRVCATRVSCCAARATNRSADTTFTLYTVCGDGSRIPVEVTRKDVRNLNLRVRADGSVALSIPRRCSRATAQEFLDRRADWIAGRVAQAGAAAEAREHPVPGEGPDAGTLPLWGELVAAGPALGLKADELAALTVAELQERIDALYRNEVGQALPGVAERLEARMGVHAARWQVRTMKTRWGSCTTKTGAIRINGALAAYPPECLEYVVAHELAHLVEPSHNERFHAVLDKVCPNNRAARELLKQSARDIALARGQEQERRGSGA